MESRASPPGCGTVRRARRVWIVVQSGNSPHLICGAAVTPPVLDSALAAEVRARRHRKDVYAGLLRTGEIGYPGTLFTAQVSNVSGHARA